MTYIGNEFNEMNYSQSEIVALLLMRRFLQFMSRDDRGLFHLSGVRYGVFYVVYFCIL